jgi:hypothetical protein
MMTVGVDTGAVGTLFPFVLPAMERLMDTRREIVGQLLLTNKKIHKPVANAFVANDPTLLLVSTRIAVIKSIFGEFMADFLSIRPTANGNSTLALEVGFDEVPLSYLQEQGFRSLVLKYQLDVYRMICAFLHTRGEDAGILVEGSEIRVVPSYGGDGNALHRSFFDLAGVPIFTPSMRPSELEFRERHRTKRSYAKMVQMHTKALMHARAVVGSKSANDARTTQTPATPSSSSPERP